MKKMILLALAAASVAMFALPAVASAGTWHALNAGAFTGHGGTSELTTTAGNRVHCTGVTLAGSYDTTTTGTLTLKFSTCVGPFNVHCQSAGAATGEIVTTTLPFHNVILDTTKVEEKDVHDPGVLITPGANEHFATFVCFGITTVVKGNGILGEITAPKCGESSTSATLSFARATSGGTPVAGHQKWTQVTTSGTTYGLNASVGGGAASPASMEGSGTVTFGNEVTMDCTTP